MKTFKGKILTLITGFLTILIIPNSRAGDILTDSLALVALYDSTDGDNWTSNAGWKTDPLDAWYGVSFENGRINSISLQNNNLSGCIPSAIGDLDSLTELDLSRNSGLTDSLPSEISNLSKLEILYLQRCDLKGHIPPELGNLANIRQLDLSRNSLTGPVPSSLGNLSNLNLLSLNDNNLSDSIPVSLANLSVLTFLALNNNSLTGNIPPELGNMPNLVELYLNSNSLSGTIPATLGNLSRMAYLYLGYNNLEGSIPPELLRLKDLNTLSLTGNQLTGGIPEDIDSLTGLRTLMLAGNPLGGTIPQTLGNISGLQHLYLDGCQLSGSIPSEIFNLSGLRTLSLSHNELTGNLPSQISNLSDLGVLNIVDNQFTGDIPPELGNLTGLQFLSLQLNNFTGVIPSELGNLTELIDLGLNNNQLTGIIPPELGNLTNLTQLIVNDNELSGPVPQELTNLIQLKYIYLNNNKLEKLPDFSGLTLISEFYIQHNRFTFGDLEPNIHILNSFYPQDSLDKPDTAYFTVGDTLKLFTVTDGHYNHYRWTFNGIELNDNALYSGTGDSVLKIMNPSLTDTGVFSCKVTNDTVAGITLYRYPVYLLPGVKITAIPGGIQCTNVSVQVDYKSAKVSSGNIFTLELSDSSGNFDGSRVIGSKSGTDSTGTVNGLIPDDISSGDSYRVRITSSSPPYYGVPGAGTLNIMNGMLSVPSVIPPTDTGFCEGETLIISTDTLPGQNYIWYRNNVVISGASAGSYTVSEEGSYYVTTFNACSTDSMASDFIHISVLPLPAVTLSLDGVLLTATQNTSYSYVWFMNGNNLGLENTQYQYTALENGEYYVEVTDVNGCSAISNNQIVSNISGFKDYIPFLDIYPNPTKDKVFITMTRDAPPVHITVTDLAGKIIYDTQSDLKHTPGILEIDLSDQVPGIYIFDIKSADGRIHLKVIKQ